MIGQEFAHVLTTAAPRVVAACDLTNRDDLVAELRHRDAPPRSDDDGDLVAALLSVYGPETARRLRGSFAFAAATPDGYVLARDPFGLRGLHYTAVGGGLAVASTLAGVAALGEATPSLDLTAFTDLALVGRLAGTRTALAGIHAARPGHVTEVDRHGVATSTRFHHLPASAPSTRPLAESGRALVDSLREVLSGCGPGAAVALSGGLDSALLAAIGAEVGMTRAWVVREGTQHPDAVHAHRVARSLGLRVHTVDIDHSAFLAVVPGYLAAAGQPTGLGSVGTCLLLRAVDPDQPVLSGEGADDVFGGYGDYLQTMKDRAAVLRRADALAAQGFTPSAEAAALIDRINAVTTYPEYAAVFAALHELGPYTGRDAHLTAALAHRAGRDLRLPFLDAPFLDRAVALPAEHKVDHTTGIDKRVLRHAVLAAFGDNDAVVDSVLRRKFGAPSSVRGSQERYAAACARAVTAEQHRRHPLGAFATTPAELAVMDLFARVYGHWRGSPPEGYSAADHLAEWTSAAVQA
ncbi:asparagine synthase-related protein [Actinokineospora soli]|uniref:asparagine synthase (glutamine-hydrolyzing) n=1 Tax=Actinokineospora soli TaxID=1048753 RepID=A0ABW2TT58_9PSEU